MKKIRIGKDINIKCHILTNNEEVSLLGRDLTVYLISSYGRKYEMKYTVEETSILFTFLGIEQKDEGNYTLTVYENQYKEKQSIVDVCNCFKLVKCTCLEEDDTVDNNIEIETIDLSANIEFGGTSASDVDKDYVDTQLQLKLDKSTYEEDKTTFAIKSEIPDVSNFVTNDVLDGKGFISSIPSEYITESELKVKGYATTSQLSNYITISTADGKYQPKGDYITEIKTINGQSLEGSGNIEIQGGGSGISDAPTDGKKYVRQNGNWTVETTVDTSSFATKTELNSKANTSDIPTNISELTNDSGYITSIPSEYITVFITIEQPKLIRNIRV